jgi:hypothetical protein
MSVLNLCMQEVKILRISGSRTKIQTGDILNMPTNS